ncbi:MAG: hypothetical protein ACT7A5_15765 [Ferrovibrionaceae bacterium]
MPRRFILAAAVAAALPSPALAQQTVDAPDQIDRPVVRGNLQLQLQTDKNVRGGSYDPNSYISDSPFNAALFLDRHWSLQGTLYLNQVRTPAGGGLLQGQGLYLQQAFVNYDAERVTAFAGKFNPQFGMFWGAAPGVYGNNFAENDYWLTEGIGAGAGLKFAGLGDDRVTLAAWLKDNTALSTSLFDRPAFGQPSTVRPGRLRLGDGGAGNSRGPTSFTLSWRSGNAGGIDGLQTNVDLASLDHGNDGTRRQTMLAIGAQYQLPLGGDWSLAPLAEYVGIWNLNGAPGGVGQDRRYLNAGTALNWGNWQASAVYGLRNTEGGATAPRDRLYTASVGYTFDGGISLTAGWARQRISGATTDTIGAIVAYTAKF